MTQPGIVQSLPSASLPALSFRERAASLDHGSWVTALESADLPNPFMEAFAKVPKGPGILVEYSVQMKGSYGLACLTKEALVWLAQLSADRSILSVGTGSAYVEHQLTEAGFDVVRLHLGPRAEKEWLDPSRDRLIPISEQEVTERVANHSNRALLFSYPGRAQYAIDALTAYEQAGGQRIICIAPVANHATYATSLPIVDKLASLARCGARVDFHEQMKSQGRQGSWALPDPMEKSREQSVVSVSVYDLTTGRA